MKKTLSISRLFMFGLFLSLSIEVAADSPIRETMDGIVTRFYATLDREALVSLNQERVLQLVTAEEREILATKYWSFEVNVPVIVSLMRNVNQAEIPYWIEEAGFQKTDGIVKNELRTYEVWQKPFDAGRVELGINGFDRHLAVYFVCVGPQTPGAEVKISSIQPEDTSIIEMKQGAWYLRDWNDLLIEELPESLVGQQLLTTFRGRSWEAHLVGAFRTTQFPSSDRPDHVVLTWSDDPRTTQTIQWRTNTSVSHGAVGYWPIDSSEENRLETAASTAVIEDRLLMNDRYTHRHTAVLRGLDPGTTYAYVAGSPKNGKWTDQATFTTAPEKDSPFSFIFLGDVHCWGDEGVFIRSVAERHPEAAFYLIAGDITRTGLYRDDWDLVFEYARDLFNRKPVMWSLGNHDQPNGLGGWLPLALVEHPRNGPEGIIPEQNYSFRYGNALFMVMDVETDPRVQADWMDATLATTDAAWRFGMFHFPLYAIRDDGEYAPIRRRWEDVFAHRGLDMMLAGHVHFYLRTVPMLNGRIADPPREGTVHAVSLGTTGRQWNREIPTPEHVAKVMTGGPWYQTINIDEERLVYRAYDANGTLCDEWIRTR